jgi:hypothetical protein
MPSRRGASAQSHSSRGPGRSRHNSRRVVLAGATYAAVLDFLRH